MIFSIFLLKKLFAIIACSLILNNVCSLCTYVQITALLCYIVLISRDVTRAPTEDVLKFKHQFPDKKAWTNGTDPDQTASEEAA